MSILPSGNNMANDPDKSGNDSRAVTPSDAAMRAAERIASYPSLAAILDDAMAPERRQHEALKEAARQMAEGSDRYMKAAVAKMGVKHGSINPLVQREYNAAGLALEAAVEFYRKVLVACRR